METDRDPLRIPNPFLNDDQNDRETTAASSGDNTTRSASTSIFYLITPHSPTGAFHRNSGRTVHTLHRGRGRYVIIHADEVEGTNKKARIETFVVGHDLLRGEKLQWVVEGGKYKASFLLPDEYDSDGNPRSDGLLISETVIPGFEYSDHDFMRREKMDELLTLEQTSELQWLLRKS